MSKPRVITLENNVKAILKAATGDTLKKAALAGGQVIEANAKINVNNTFSSKSTSGAGLGGSIQTVVSKSTKTRAEVDIGPTVIYGRIRELGGLILPIHGKMLSWLLGNGSGTGKQKALGRVFVNKEGRVFAERVQVTATPYLRPAVDEHENEIRQAVGYQLKKGIEAVT